MRRLNFIIMSILLLSVAAGCKPSSQEQVVEGLQKGIAIAAEGFKANAAACEGMNRFPRTYQADTLVAVDAYDWTSGFFAGDLWLAYELTGDEALAEAARKYTAQLYEIKDFT